MGIRTYIYILKKKHSHKQKAKETKEEKRKTKEKKEKKMLLSWTVSVKNLMGLDYIVCEFALCTFNLCDQVIIFPASSYEFNIAYLLVAKSQYLQYYNNI